MELSKAIGTLQQEVDSYFEKLEEVSEKDDEIIAQYDIKLEELDA
jgi:hypothetical protein